MVEFSLDDDDRGSSSDNDQDELMEDAEDIEHEVDVDVEADGDGDGDGDGDEDDNDNDDDNGDEDEEDDTAEQPLSQVRRPSLPTTNASSDDTPTMSQVNGVGPTSHPRPTVTRTSASPRQASVPAQTPKMRYEARAEALTASTYDIVPTMAAPQSTSINATTATPDMRYWFTGGSDCYIRKYDGVATVNGKTLLTVAQRHPFVDSVVKAGVLMSYWDNEEPVAKNPGEDPPLSPVYSLAVQSQALWMLSGLESGCINLYSVRHDEGKRISYMQKHKSAVSVLTLAQDEKSVLSGSWDKNVFDWDLNTGQVKRSFEGSGGQISAIEIRPASSLPVPEESGEPVQTNGTFSSNNDEKPHANGFSNGANGSAGDGNNEDAPGSPTDSLFGGGSDANSLFGETDGAGATSGVNFGDDDDDFSRAIEMNLDNREPLDADGDLPIGNAQTENDATAPAVQQPVELQNGAQNSAQASAVSHEIKAESSVSQAAPETQDAVATSDSTFLAASTDGTLRIWDRRQPNPVAKIPTRTGVPPWCMAACWSPDGNYIYAGRRNGTVEEFSLHKGLKTAQRTFKFPPGSGAVSALRAMPNGRHLIWQVHAFHVSASHDILRLYDLKEPQAFKHSTVPFLIVPGPPRAGVISSLYIDPTCKYMLSAAGTRGWEGSSTEVLIGYEIGIPS
ncbi:WD40 repeat-like protein [Venustampulla echinocandica]|uniref:WD40 repeat-like protein n=1 Tax=Venustampulla echinocandica TaxID=2656787 RepID=A0A370U1K5_9HELO|nr:WD40 repeat-like protein [Venustampulla echinocandica]RDL41660.1 WD40 repeat-like protein [Venustampulla echinocandica]